MAKPTVLVLAGGDSPERDVSLETGRGIHAALGELGYKTLAADPARPDISLDEAGEELFADTAINTLPPKQLEDVFDARGYFVDSLRKYSDAGVDIVFNALHGGVGEDGTVQAVMDFLGIKYTGSGAAACALAMDKTRSKHIALAAGVTVPRSMYVRKSALAAGTLEQSVRESLPPHLVIKPNNGGSSVGMSIITDFAQLDEAAALAFQYDEHILIEEFIAGTELTQAVIEGVADIPCLEIRPKDGWYDYKNKYQAGSCEYIVPAPVDADISAKVKAYAERTFHALGCEVYGRVDFRVDADGEPHLLEANTLPGFTATSLVPKMAKAVGMDYNALVDHLLRLSLEK